MARLYQGTQLDDQAPVERIRQRPLAITRSCDLEPRVQQPDAPLSRWRWAVAVAGIALGLSLLALAFR